jgi:hypothetical protein
MSALIKLFVVKEELFYHLATNEGFERKGCGHVAAKAESRNVDQQVGLWKVVENVALRFVGEYEVANQGHDQAEDKTHTCRCVGDCVEPVERGRFEAAVDEQRVVMAHKLLSARLLASLTANEITPIASKTLGLINARAPSDDPRRS